MQRGGLSLADRRTVVHSTSERIDAGPGDLEPDFNPDPNLDPKPDFNPDLDPDRSS